MSGAINRINEKLEAEKKPAVDRPRRETFEEFLREDAMVPAGGGLYTRFSFEGREVLLAPVRIIDRIFAGEDGQPLHDSLLALAGGAQFGKTTLELLLAAYCTSQKFLNFGLYLPDDKLADVVIDTKFRPDVVDQIPWLARMTQTGKAVTESGKAVNTKKAATITDGVRRANLLVAGLQKPATTISLDVTARDEEDDCPPKNAKFVKGRMTNSKYRVQFILGTQRVNGRGQQKAWKDASQGVELLGVESEAWQYEVASEVDYVPKGFYNPEEKFPEIVRHAVTGVPRRDDPKLTWTGDFRHNATGEVISRHTPKNVYYLADPETGEPLNRNRPIICHRQAGRIEQRQWSVRISQLGLAAIGLSQIVGQFQLAVNDPEEMIVFRCDVLALPQSTAQALNGSVLERAQNINPFEMRIVREPQRAAFAGLDMGDKCYLTVREVEDPACKRLIYAATVPIGDATKRMKELAGRNLWDCLFIDQRPEVSVARDIALALNGLDLVTEWPVAPKETDKEAAVSFDSGLAWNGHSATWQGLKCAVVRFDYKKLGKGIGHGLDCFDQDGFTKFVPVILCNREESVDRVVREFLTPIEGVTEVLGGQLRVNPAVLLPSGSLPIITTLKEHFVTGSEREKSENGELGDYVDQVANHFLFANAYSALAEIVAVGSRGAPILMPIPVQRTTESARNHRDKNFVMA